ncbi:MAG: UDP-3-O-acyl-N-acetylglucosamine deacetylase [Candidatus Sericytochromatia bacterium]|nr:UDP-3-O-acyl-N-acetylglucosamine deacetylase [Candidatus Sericytochromatia bacterium]
MIVDSFSPFQATVARPVLLPGIGLHSGEPVNVRILPAPVHHGLVFLREDLPGRPRIPARTAFVTDTTLCTTLARGKATVRTVEHLLAALYAMGVTNAVLAVDGPEVPALDGSAMPVVRALEAVGLSRQDAPVRALALAEPVEVVREDRRVAYEPAEEAWVRYQVDYGHPLAGPQVLQLLVTPANLREAVLEARTFCLEAEAERMRAMGLARGGSVENAVVIHEHGTSTPLRHADEFVRHKILDLVGDLALTGARWVGAVSATRAGHALHVALAARLEELAGTEAVQAVRPVGSEEAVRVP